MKQENEETKNIIANFAHRLSEIARELGDQMNGSKVTQKEVFFIGILRRQVILLSDASLLLQVRQADSLASTFIIFRCLLDDFILMIYLETKQFDEDYIIAFLAQSVKKEFDMYEHSLNLNLKYFQGKQPGLTTQEWYDKRLNDFYNDKSNDIYFSNLITKKWKSFPTVRSMVYEFPNDDLGRANAHAFILWQLMSKYVHYSNLGYRLDSASEPREIEIKQLAEALFYVFKTISSIQDRLKKYGYDVKLNDKTELLNELEKFGSSEKY